MVRVFLRILELVRFYRPQLFSDYRFYNHDSPWPHDNETSSRHERHCEFCTPSQALRLAASFRDNFILHWVDSGDSIRHCCFYDFVCDSDFLNWNPCNDGITWPGRKLWWSAWFHRCSQAFLIWAVHVGHRWIQSRRWWCGTTQFVLPSFLHIDFLRADHNA